MVLIYDFKSQVVGWSSIKFFKNNTSATNYYCTCILRSAKNKLNNILEFVPNKKSIHEFFILP
jgi:hypothetical protein